jgi:hypothetical protein
MLEGVGVGCGAEAAAGDAKLEKKLMSTAGTLHSEIYEFRMRRNPEGLQANQCTTTSF